MNREQLEFAISQYLDGTLPPEEKAALQRRLATDPAAARLLEEYRILDGVMKQSSPPPAVAWDRLAERISASVAAEAMPVRSAGEQDPGVSEELELAIVRHVDGELSAEEWAALEPQLAENPAAKRCLAQHRSLEAVTRHAWPLPEVNWQRLAHRISEAVDVQSAASRYSIVAWLQHAPRLAMAACLLIAMGLIVFLMLPAPQQALLVIGPEPETAQGTQVLEISLSNEPATVLVDAGFSPVVNMPSTVRLAAHVQPASSEGAWFTY